MAASRRNYKAMKDDKLAKTLDELINGGDAAKRAVSGGGSPQEDYEKAVAEFRARGLSAPDWPQGGLPLPAVPAQDAPVEMVGAHLARGAATVSEVTAGHDVVLEPKLDGFWLQVHVGEGNIVTAWTRQGAVVTERLPAHVRQWAGMQPGTRIVGELCLFDSNGHPGSSHDVHSLMRRTSKDPTAAGTEPLSFIAFDCIESEGKDITMYGLTERRWHLKAAVTRLPIGGSTAVIDQGTASDEAYTSLVARGYEGCILKDPDAAYAPGSRGAGVWKVKHKATIDALVMDFKAGEDGYEGMLGSIQFGQLDSEAGCIVQRGYVSSGLTFDQRREIWANRDDYVGRVLEIGHMGCQAGGFRHPRFLRWRDDKPAEEVTLHDS